ncbi:MAG: ATP-binding protein [Xanthomonadales bacterium]|jgi:signal transduction histidine kinase|nr:ATP-binding protein [Xanthomonadales bacterium]
MTSIRADGRNAPGVVDALPAELAGLPLAVARIGAHRVIEAANAMFCDWLAVSEPVTGQLLDPLLAAWLGSTVEVELPRWREWWLQPVPASAPLLLTGDPGLLQFVRSDQGLLIINRLPEPEADASSEVMSLVPGSIGSPDASQILQSKSRLFMTVSHDLLQPLNAARIYAAALEDLSGLDPVAADISRRIDLALRNAEEIVDTLVDVARFDTSNVEAKVETLDLDRLLEPLVDQYGVIAVSRGLDLRRHVCRLRARSDPRLLRRLLQNLIGNALRYTARGGVLIGARRRGAMVRIEVWDTGPGIPPVQQALVFEEFRRLETQSPWNERGLGLGLWICRRIAALLDHRLDLRSVPGRGSVFAIEIPWVADDTPLPVLPSRPVGLVVGLADRSLALVLDPDADVRSALQALLGGWGLHVLAASDPVGAVMALQGRAPLLVLVDEHVSGGLAVLEAWPAGKGTQRIYCTADRQGEAARQAQAAGVLLLGKPLKPARLRAIVEDAARRVHLG